MWLIQFIIKIIALDTFCKGYIVFLNVGIFATLFLALWLLLDCLLWLVGIKWFAYI